MTSTLRSITLRLPEEEYAAFTIVCNEKGYSKTGKIREFIRTMVKTEIGKVEISAGEWEKIRLSRSIEILLFDKRGAIKDKDIQRL